MKNKLLSMLFLLASFTYAIGQNVDSFTVSDNAPNLYDSVYLINLSTNYTSLEWIVSSSSFHPLSGFLKDSVVIGHFNKTGCHDISLIVGRGTNYDTITKICAVRSYDRNPPTLTLLKPLDTLEAYDHFIEWGYTVSDNYCEASGIKVYTSGSIDSSILGLSSYKIWAVDCEGNFSDTLTQEVWVLDRTPPVIEWTGNAITTIERGDTLDLNYVMATDNYDTNLSVQMSGTYFSIYLKYFEIGLYYIQFNAVDFSGNQADSIYVFVYVVYISLPETPVNALNIYPNPNSGHFSIENKNPNQAIHSYPFLTKWGKWFI